MKWLLEHGIDYSIRDEAGKTAEDRLAEAKQHHEAKKALDIIKLWKVRTPSAPLDPPSLRVRRVCLTRIPSGAQLAGRPGGAAA